MDGCAKHLSSIHHIPFPCFSLQWGVGLNILHHWDSCSVFSVAFSLWGQEIGGEKRVRLTYILPSGSCLKLLLLFSHQALSDSLRPHALQHTRLSCPALSPGVCWNSCLLSEWCYPTISSSVTPFSSCPQSSPASTGDRHVINFYFFLLLLFLLQGCLSPESRRVGGKLHFLPYPSIFSKPFKSFIASNRILSCHSI